MKRNKNDSSLAGLLYFALGGFVLGSLFKKKSIASIGGLKNAERNLIPYISNDGIKEFENDIRQFNQNEIGEIIRMIIEARIRKSLAMPFYKTLKGTPISCELRKNQWRIFIYVLNDSNFIMLSIFKKKTDKTPKNEIEKAEFRLKEFLNRKS